MLQNSDQFDHFQIRGHIAQGGMSDIYRAVDLTSGKEVALKIPNRFLIGDPAQFEHFRREMEVTNTLKHPAIQKGISTGQFNCTPYIATELIEGRLMRDYIHNKAPFTPDEAISLIRKIADGLRYCHDKGVIHRDLKPENILIKLDGQPVIIDFGLALTKDAHRVTYANLSTTSGTPDYMAPEQIEGQRGDERTDQYAIGTMLYELLCGHTPFMGDNYNAILVQHRNSAIPRLDKEVMGVSPQLAAVVATTLQHNPDARYPNLRALINALEHLDEIDITILDTVTGAPTVTKFWKREAFRVTVGIILIMLSIILLGFLGQALSRVVNP